MCLSFSFPAEDDALSSGRAVFSVCVGDTGLSRIVGRLTCMIISFHGCGLFLHCCSSSACCRCVCVSASSMESKGAQKKKADTQKPTVPAPSSTICSKIVVLSILVLLAAVGFQLWVHLNVHQDLLVAIERGDVEGVCNNPH